MSPPKNQIICKKKLEFIPISNAKTKNKSDICLYVRTGKNITGTRILALFVLNTLFTLV